MEDYSNSYETSSYKIVSARLTWDEARVRNVKVNIFTCQSTTCLSVCLPGLSQYVHVTEDKVSCSRAQRSDSGESRTSNPLVPSLTLYH